jgi:hypothetical protein
MLSALVGAITERVQLRIVDGSLRIEDERFVLRPNFSLDYSVDRSQLTFPIEEQTDKTCDPAALERVVMSSVKQGQEFQAITTLFDDDSPHHDELEQFIHMVATDAACKPGDVSSRSIARHIDVVIADFEKSRKLDYQVKVWLRGITLADDAIKVSEDLVFRRPNRMDFQERIPARMLNYAHALHMKTSFSCIVDMKIRTEFPMGAQRLVDKLVTTLRLYRLGAVVASRLDMAADSFSMFARFSVGGPQLGGKLHYELKQNESATLSAFLDQITKYLPSHIEQLPSVPSYLTTAVEWYDQALFRDSLPEGTIASAVASLESLFLKSVQAEVTYRLAQRVAGLLRCFGFPPLEVKTSIVQAYSVRSRYVHGDQREKKWDHERLQALAQQVCEYVRVSLVIFCQLGASLSRSDLLLLLDDSLLDDVPRETLKTQLCHVNVPNVARSESGASG